MYGPRAGSAGPAGRSLPSRIAAYGPGAHIDRRKAAWFSAAREATGAGSRVVRREAVTAVAPDGTARFDLGQPVPRRSMWAAVDLASGDFALAAPEGYPLRRVDLPPGALRPAAADRFDRFFALDRELAMLFVARPQVGAWALTSWDGAPDDEDGPANLRLSLAFSRMDRVGEGQVPPAELLAGDVVVLMDPNAMQVAAARLVGGGK